MKRDEEYEYLAIYSEKCLRCAAFVVGAQKKFTKCHYDNGNSECPAAGVRVVVVGKVERYAKRIRAARKAKDPAREARIWEALSKESAPFLHKLYERLGDNL